MNTYRVISFYRTPLLLSTEVFHEHMAHTIQQVELLLSTNSMGCTYWQASIPILSQNQPSPSVAWVICYDFHHVAEATKWVQQLQNLSSSQHLWWVGNTLHYLLKQTDSNRSLSVQVIRFAKKSDHLSPEQFRDYWRLNHAPIAIESPFLQQYEQLHLLTTPTTLEPDICDGFTLSSFQSLEDLTAHSQHPAGKTAALDTTHFLYPEPQPTVLTHITHQHFFN